MTTPDTHQHLRDAHRVVPLPDDVIALLDRHDELDAWLTNWTAPSDPPHPLRAIIDDRQDPSDVATAAAEQAPRAEIATQSRQYAAKARTEIANRRLWTVLASHASALLEGPIATTTTDLIDRARRHVTILGDLLAETKLLHLVASANPEHAAAAKALVGDQGDFGLVTGLVRAVTRDLQLDDPYGYGYWQRPDLADGHRHTSLLDIATAPDAAGFRFATPAELSEANADHAERAKVERIVNKTGLLTDGEKAVKQAAEVDQWMARQ